MRTSRDLPVPLRVAATVAVAFFLLPLVGLCWRTPWASVLDHMAGREIRDALWLSFQCSLAASLLSLALGLPMATWLASGSSRIHAAVRVLVTLPMVLPPVVGGVAMLLAYGRNGIVGAPIEQWLGVALPFTREGVILAEAYVSMPFLVLTVEGGLRSLDRRFGDAAATLGASPWRVFRTVTLPMIAPSLRAGLLVAWARALGEFGATITFAGNLAGHTRTMPLAVHVALETSPNAAIVLSLILVMTSGCVLFALRKQWFPAR